jgi:hypothetical protein
MRLFQAIKGRPSQKNRRGKNLRPGYNHSMRWVTSSLAALLSLLLVSAPVSAWACDLSCSSLQARSDCHSSTTTSKDDTATSMPSGMDMGSDHNESSMGPDAVINPLPGHSMPMFPHQEMAMQNFGHTTNLALGTRALRDHSKSVSSCTHETCSQVSASASPPGADHPQPGSPHRIAMSVPSPVNLWIAFHWIRPGIPPPELLTADRLVTILRI